MKQTRIGLNLVLAAGLCLLSGCGESGGEKKEKTTLEYSRDLASNLYLVRLDAVKALSESATPEDTVATPHLIGMLRDGNETIRRFAAAALGKIRDPLAIPALLEAATDENNFVRYQSVGALVNFYDDPRVLPAVVKALEDENGYVRHIAVTRIGQTGDPAMTDTVLPLLNDENNYVRSAAAAALGNLGSAQAVNPLIRALDDPNSYVRSFAATSLGRLEARQAIPGLKRRLNDPSPWVVNHAARALAWMGNDEGIPYLIANLSSPVQDKENAICEEAAEFLREISGKNFGFDSGAPEEKRREAIDRWKAWAGERGTGAGG